MVSNGVAPYFDRELPESPQSAGWEEEAGGDHAIGGTCLATETTPFYPEAANVIFMLVSSRYERASLFVTSNKPFFAWGEIFGDAVVAAARSTR